MDGHKFRGSKLHNASFPKLISHREIDFDLTRDSPAMEAACLGETITIPYELLINPPEIKLNNWLPVALNEVDKTSCSTSRKTNDFI